VVPNATPSSGHTDTAGTSGLDFPVLDAAEIIASPAVERPADEPPDPELPRLDMSPEDLFDTFAAPQQNGFSGKTVRVLLDKKEPLIPHTSDRAIVERYRRLRTKIQQQSAVTPIKSLLVASPGPGEGKTVTAVNLALSFAMMSSFKVLVVDGDLRKGTIRKWFGLDNLPGLSNLIEGSASLEDIILKSDELPFHFMLSGNSKRPATELLTSPVLQSCIRQMSQHFDLVLVDSPPVNLIADAQMLAGGCDGVLLVARAFATTNKAFEKAMHDLLPFRIVGTVLNGGMRGERYHSYYKY
jgi:capsular exopolysaccharide synthesis family protein